MANKQNYSMFPNYIIDNKIFALMTPYESKVYMVIARGCSNKQGTCGYTMDTIADKAGLNIKTIYKALEGLKRYKIIKSWQKVIDATKRKSFYRISWGGTGIKEQFETEEAIKAETEIREKQSLKNKEMVLSRFKNTKVKGLDISSLVGNIYESRKPAQNLCIPWHG